MLPSVGVMNPTRTTDMIRTDGLTRSFTVGKQTVEAVRGLVLTVRQGELVALTDPQEDLPSWQIAPPLPFIPRDRVGDLFCVLVTCWNGPHEEAGRVLRPLRDVAEVRAEQVGVMPFPALQSAFDGMVPKGMQHYWKADFITELTDEAIAAHVEHGRLPPLGRQFDQLAHDLLIDRGFFFLKGSWHCCSARAHFLFKID